MSDTLALFPDLMASQPSEARTTGILPSQRLQEMVATGHIKATSPIDTSQIQACSIDLRLGSVGYEVCASFLPSVKVTVEKKLKELKLRGIRSFEAGVAGKGESVHRSSSGRATPAGELLRQGESEKQHRTPRSLH